MITVTPLPKSETAPSEESIKAIAFTIGEYELALPIDAVLQVSQSPTQLSSHREGVSLIVRENRTIVLLNLHAQLLEPQPQLLPGETGDRGPQRSQYLILTQTRRGELCGIPIDELPNLLDLPLASIQPIPNSNRRSRAFGLAKFTALWQPPQRDEPAIVYLLDVEQALHSLE